MPWIFNVDFSVNYEVAVAPGVKLALNLSIFNVFNFQEATRVDESYTIRNADPIPNGTVADLQNLQVQNRVGSPVRHIDPSNPDDLNPNFGQAVARQLPRYARIGLKLSF